jgi:hypothetical protein
VRRQEKKESNLKKRDPEFYRKCNDVIQGQVQKGYLLPLGSVIEAPDDGFQIPIFPVRDDSRSTTKVRMVLDCAAKFEGISLNDNILPGPKLLNELVDVLTRFRRYPIAIVGDISEMFLQISLVQQDRKFYRIVWGGEVFEYQRTIFGDTSSPYKANQVIKEHTRRLAGKYPEAQDTIENALYMDDTLDSRCSTEKAKETRSQVSKVMDRAGMKMRKWISNDPGVLKDIPKEDRAVTVEINGKETLPNQKTLGILWIAEEDVICIKSRQIDQNHPATRRGVLKCMASLFDPLGLVDPFRIRAWIIFQKTWVRNGDWDSPLDEDLLKEWKSWEKELPKLDTIRVGRHLGMNEGDETELHVFGDASKEAFSATVYARTKTAEGNIVIRLILAKTRLSPLKSISIPRLELCGAVLGTRLAERVVKTLESGSGAQTLRVTYWTDSMNVLYWICQPGKEFKAYVANRVGEIQERTSSDQWRHVPTKQNPADIATRGLSLEELSTSKLWWEGPCFLLQDEKNWPERKIPHPGESAVEEKSPTFAVGVEGPEDKTSFALHPSHWSDLRKLTRRIGFVRRLAAWIMKKPLSKGIQKWTSELKNEEYQEAEDCVLRMAQKDEFGAEIKALKAGKPLPRKSNLLPLNPMIDESGGLLRLRSRLENVRYLTTGEKFPVILPRKHATSRLVIQKAHREMGHPVGRDATIVQLRKNYWIIRIREAVREVEHNCMRCKIHEAKPTHQMMAPLPSFRLNPPMRAFAKTGMDFAGPYLVKQGRGITRAKRYLAVFTCLQVRAIHLEPVYCMDTESFLMAFSRMTSRRSVPVEVVTDNGSNFVAGEKELRKLAENIDWDKVQKKTIGYSNTGIKWNFNPPAAPHFGGVFEIMVKSAKRALKAIVGDADITDEEFHTFVVEAEGLINSRPLTPPSADFNDILPLTPNHFLHGQLGGQLAPPSVDNENRVNPRKRWHRVQELLRHFWRRWKEELLPMLHNSKKWLTPKENLKEGDLAIVVDEKLPRGQWKIGHIQEVFPGEYE